MKNIANFSRIDEQPGRAGSTVGFGGTTPPSSMASLKSEGFAAVINLLVAAEPGARVEECRVGAEETGLKYIHLPFNPKSPDPGLVDNFMAAIGDAANQPVYIYCNTATRVAALWMVARVLGDGWKIDAASEEAKTIAAKPDEAIGFATKYLELRGS
jgi:uncharacterized protein (TIGR01244 family)